METKIVSITIKIGDIPFVLPFEEARQLFFELENIFRPKSIIEVPSVFGKSTISPYTITWSDTSGAYTTQPAGSTN